LKVEWDCCETLRVVKGDINKFKKKNLKRARFG
jgi:hypothetical protein